MPAGLLDAGGRGSVVPRCGKGVQSTSRLNTQDDRPLAVGSWHEGRRSFGGMAGIKRVGPVVWEIPREGGMLVPGLVFASGQFLKEADLAHALDQVRNVAHLPGIVKFSMAMPDIHTGYGFPIG